MIVVYYAASGYTWDGVIHKMPNKQWQAMLDVHVTAPFKLIQAVAPLMREAAKQEQEAGGQAAPRSIINISSTSGTHGEYPSCQRLELLRHRIAKCRPSAGPVLQAVRHCMRSCTERTGDMQGHSDVHV